MATPPSTPPAAATPGGAGPSPSAAAAAEMPAAGEPEGPPVVPTVGGSRAPFVSAAAEIGPVVWATEVESGSNAPGTVVEAFPSDAPAIYAALPVTRLEAGTTVTASWAYNGTPLSTFRNDLVAARGQAGGWIEFHISRAGSESWPTGIYSVTVRVGDQVAQAAAVAVEGREDA